MSKNTGQRGPYTQARDRSDDTVRLTNPAHDDTVIQALHKTELPPAPRPSQNLDLSDTDSTDKYVIEEEAVPVGVLIALAGKTVGQAHVVMDGENTIGRTSASSITIPDSCVSEHHLKLVHADGIFALARISTTNPTSVNGSSLDAPANLEDGDIIETVGHRFVFRTTFRGA